MIGHQLYLLAGVHKSQGDPGDKNLYDGVECLHVISVKLLHVTLGLSNFEVTTRCLDSLWSSACY